MKALLKGLLKAILVLTAMSWSGWMVVYSFTIFDYPDWVHVLNGSSFLIYITLICTDVMVYKIEKFMAS